MFTSKAKLCGIIGNPVCHSMSPLFHMTISQSMGVDLAYVPLLVENDISAAIKGAFELGFFGLNITAPYKEDVIKHIEEIDDLARSIGSVNTLVRTLNGYKGYNTDILGLYKSLADFDIKLENTNVIVLGAGGAAKSVLHMCAYNKVSSITLINRSLDKAKRLSKEIIDKYPDITINCFGLADMDNKNIFSILDRDEYISFQTTSLGMYPDIQKCPIDMDIFYEKTKVGVDLIYSPLETQFIKRLIKKQKTAINGLDMLINQGILAWQLWNDNITVDNKTITLAKTAVLEHLRSKA